MSKKYTIRAKRVTHYEKEYIADSKDEALKMSLNDIVDGWDDCNDDEWTHEVVLVEDTTISLA